MKLDRFIPLMVPDINENDINAVVNVLKSGMIIQGEKVNELETTIANYLGVKNVIAVSNGTATLHLSLVALGIGPGDEVLVPALSYIATANVIELVGATPIFVDISCSTFNIDCDLIENKITSKTKAIIPVHEFGLACDISRICSIAKKNNLFVIEDAACALGATEDGRFVGTFGEVGSFSFHPRKAITSGEGGIITTNNDELASRLRVLRNHGVSVENGKMEFVEAGYNYRLTDFQAALVLSQFNRFSMILDYKKTLSKIYNEFLISDSIQLPKVGKNKTHTWQSYHILISDSINRDELILKLKRNGIGTNYGAQCMPNEKFFKNKYQLDCDLLFPNAMKANSQGLVLPLYEKLKEEEIKQICSVILNSL
jgi:perosamine synthetase